MSFAWTSISQTSTTNLVTNGTMEVDANWASSGTPTVNARSSAKAIEGTYSRLFTVDVQYEGIRSDVFTTSTGSRYLFSFWVYPDDATSIRILLRNGAASDTPITWEFLDLTQDAWNFRTILYAETAGGANAIVYFQSAAGVNSGSYYIDDVRVTVVDSPEADASIVPNGTMEADSNWTSVGTPTSNVRSTTQVYSGTYSRYFAVDAADEGIQSDTFTTVTNRVYKVSLYTQPSVATTAYFRIRNGANTGWSVNLYVRSIYTSVWNIVEFIFVENAGGSGAYIQLLSSPGLTTGGWYYDQIRIIQDDKAKFRIDHMNEAKTNVDHLTTQLGISAYSWTVLPVAANTNVTSAQVNQLMTAISYVDTNNTCATHNSTYNSGALTGDDNAIHTGKDATIYSSHDTGIHTGKDATIYSSHDTGIHTGKDATIYSGQDSGIHTGKDSTVHTSQNSYYLNDHNTAINSGQYSTVYNPANSYNLATNWGSADNGKLVYCGSN